jgi:hypothetical protein
VPSVLPVNGAHANVEIGGVRFSTAMTTGASNEALRDRLAHLHAHYEDVEPGDRYALTYLPGVGTELSKNGRRLAVVSGSDFAAAYFSMWLGDDPIDAGLRDALRNGLSERARN